MIILTIKWGGQQNILALPGHLRPPLSYVPDARKNICKPELPFASENRIFVQVHSIDRRVSAMCTNEREINQVN